MPDTPSNWYPVPSCSHAAAIRLRLTLCHPSAHRARSGRLLAGCWIKPRTQSYIGHDDRAGIREIEAHFVRQRGLPAAELAIGSALERDIHPIGRFAGLGLAGIDDQFLPIHVVGRTDDPEPSIRPARTVVRVQAPTRMQ